MLVQIWQTGGSGWTDYSPWIFDRSLPITHALNQPRTMEFVLTNAISGFVLPVAGNRVQFISGAFGVNFLGYIVNVPEASVLGADQSGNPIYGYKISCVDESLILEWNTSSIFPALPPFANRTQGQIIKDLILLLGGTFTTTNVADGILIPYFRVKPEESFWDAVRRLSDRTNMKLWFLNGAAYYQSYGDAAFSPAVNETDTGFNPTLLSVTPNPTRVYNDVVGIGNPEPQHFVVEHHIGDGLTATFPLKMMPYGENANLLMVQDWTSTTIDTKAWLKTDPNNLFSMYAGSLKLFGGPVPGTSRLTAIQGLEIAGKIEARGGRVVFNGATNAILSALMAADSGLLSDVVAGFRATPSGANTILQAIVNGALVGPTFQVTTGNYYNLVITVDCSQNVRRNRPFFSQASSFGGENVSADARVTFLVAELANNADAPSVVLSYSTTITNIQQFLFFTVLAGPMNTTDSVNVLCNFTYIFKPPQCEVWTYFPSMAQNLLLASQGFQNAPWGIWVNVARPAGPTIADPNAQTTGFALVSSGNPTNAYAGQGVLGLQTGITYTFSVWLKVPTGTQTFGLSLQDYDGVTFGPTTTKQFTVTTAWQRFSVTRTAQNAAGFLCAIGGGNTWAFNGEVDAAWPQLETGAAPGTYAVTTTVAVNPQRPGIYGAWHRERIGDKANALATYSLNSANGQAQVVFFPTSAPAQGEKVRVIYRGAGLARARVQKAASITAEAAKAGDSGIRSNILPALNPAPNNTAELERAIQAYIDDATSLFYKGTWQFDTKLYNVASLPVPGRLITINTASRYPSFAALVTSVKQTFRAFDSNGTSEIFEFAVEFGPLSRLQDEQQNFLPPEDAAIGQFDTVVPLLPIDVTNVGTAFAPDVATPDFDLNLTGTTVEIDGGITPSSLFEVRASDAGWGSGSAANLLKNPLLRVFTVPRNSNDVAVYIKNTLLPNSFSDSFNRANGALGGLWTAGGGTIAISGNAATVTAVDANSRARVYYNSALANDQFAQLTLVSTGGGIGPAVRMSSTADSYYAFYHDTANWYLFKQVAGVTTVFQSSARTPSIGDVLYIGVQGTTVTAKINGVTVSSVTDAALASGFSGIAGNTLTSGSGNNWSAGALTVPQTGTLLSRYPALVRVVYPLPPPSPTGTTIEDASNPTNLKVYIDPTILNNTNVFGFELRASDNVTVLAKTTGLGLLDSDLHLKIANATRNVSLYVYTTNLLGEYSPAYNLTLTIPAPTIVGVSVDEPSGKLIWTATNATSYYVEIAKDAAYTQFVTQKNTTDLFFVLDDDTILHQRYFRVTPSDALGNGTAATISHVHTPGTVIDSIGGVAVNNTDNAYSVAFLPSPTTLPTHPAPFQPYKPQLDELSRKQTLLNRFDNY